MWCLRRKEADRWTSRCRTRLDAAGQLLRWGRKWSRSFDVASHSEVGGWSPGGRADGQAFARKAKIGWRSSTIPVARGAGGGDGHPSDGIAVRRRWWRRDGQALRRVVGKEAGRLLQGPTKAYPSWSRAIFDRLGMNHLRRARGVN